MKIDSKLRFSDGHEMPAFGLGVFLSEEGDECANACKWALDKGYRLIDTAAYYRNEATVGNVMRESGIPREALFVTSKLWNDDHGYDSTLRAFDKSMEQLGLEYMDLYLVHYPVPEKRLDTWRAMEKIRESGRCRSIGVSNYMSWHLEELLANANTPPVLNQIEMHPFCFGNKRRESIDLCREKNIVVQCYCPLVRARRLEDPVLQKLAEKYGKTTAQILIRWALEEGFSVIPKSSKQHRIHENAEVFDFAFTPEELAEVSGLNEDFIVCWDPTQTE